MAISAPMSARLRASAPILINILVLLYGGGDDGDSGMGEGVPGGEGGGSEGEGSSTPAARTIGIHCGGLAPPRMR